MAHSEADVLSTADAVARDVVEKHAVGVDTDGAFPEASIDAIRDAGLMALISSPEVGGMGMRPGIASKVIERFSAACGSTGMVMCMHYCGTAVIEAFGSTDVRKDIVAGKHLSTLAFSEASSRSQFWAPTSTAKRSGEGIVLDARKSWITSAHQAAAYVWSSTPVEAEGPSTLWLVPRDAAGLQIAGSFNGLGLRGNDSSPVIAKGVVVPETHRLGNDGQGFEIMMGTVLPLFSLLNASCSLGLMQNAVAKTVAHVSGLHFEHTQSALRDMPTIRAYVARMRIQTDMVATLLADTAAAMESGREDAVLRVLESKAAAGETATTVLDTAMRVCGGSAFRKEVGVERSFRDARAAGIMAPTTDALYDFIGKAVTGMDLFA